VAEKWAHDIFLTELNQLTPRSYSPSWEDNRSSPSQKNSPHFMKPERIITAFYKSPSPVPVLSQIDPAHTPIPLLEDIF
jgi:hypothetical protein